jgi:hypothetical protein
VVLPWFLFLEPLPERPHGWPRHWALWGSRRVLREAPKAPPIAAGGPGDKGVGAGTIRVSRSAPILLQPSRLNIIRHALSAPPNARASPQSVRRASARPLRPNPTSSIPPKAWQVGSGSYPGSCRGARPELTQGCTGPLSRASTHYSARGAHHDRPSLDPIDTCAEPNSRQLSVPHGYSKGCRRRVIHRFSCPNSVTRPTTSRQRARRRRRGAGGI